MLDPVKQTILYDQNAIYYGYPIAKLMEKAGEGIAQVLVKKYGLGKRVGFFCGPGNNGGDGFAAGRYLLGRGIPEVYLIPASDKIITPESRKNWKMFKGAKYERIIAGDIPDHFDVVVDCLFGTGVKGELREPYLSVVRKLNKIKGKKVTIDMPTPGFKEDFVISMMFKKSPRAVVVDLGYPDYLKHKIGVGEVKVLNKPDDDSRKGDNGKLLIIGGSEKFHGAPLLSAKTAGRIVDLVYFSSVPENNELIKKMKGVLADFIAVPRAEALATAKKADVVLIGPGLGTSKEAKELVNEFIKKFPRKKFILDADALKLINRKLLNKNVIITPHKNEFKTLFGVSPTKENTVKMAKKYKCVIVLKGKVDYVSDRGELKINTTGNAGMTKGGTGDVLAGLIAALACNNDLYLAASAGVFINGLAGDRLKKRVSYYYSASDLAREIPKAIKWCEDYKRK